MKRVLWLLGGALGVQILAMSLTLAASLGIALGFPPESFLCVDWFAPCAALLVVGWWVGREANWKAGLDLGLVCVLLWLIVHLVLATRASPEFWRDGCTQLTWAHGLWWAFALTLTAGGAGVGARFSRWFTGLGLPLGALVCLILLQWSYRPKGASQVAADGTTFRLLAFNLSEVQFGVYDADSDDSQPFDDRNATWLGQPIGAVWNKIAKYEGPKLLALVNGGFFGAQGPLISTHEAPLVFEGASRYDTDLLQRDWPQQYAVLAWKRDAQTLRPQILRDVPFESLNRRFDGALGGVRVLIQDGRSAVLKPGMGGTTLRCSRTSLGWTKNQIFLLSVRDPDGEASSLRQNKVEKATGHKIQRGGWDVAQVQAFWSERGILNAVLFDGGESTQIRIREAGGLETVHSSYHFTRTLDFLNGRPLRLVLPMLPPSQANGGVLNWFYIARN